MKKFWIVLIAVFVISFSVYGLTSIEVSNQTQTPSATAESAVNDDAKLIHLITNFDLKGKVRSEKNKEVKSLFNGANRAIAEIKLRNKAVLEKHKADEPITILVLSGKGTFRAGKDLSETQKLVAGTFITLEAGIEHEIAAEPDIHVLLTKFKKN